MSNNDLIKQLHERHCQGDDLCGQAQGQIEKDAKEIKELTEKVALLEAQEKQRFQQLSDSGREITRLKGRLKHLGDPEKYELFTDDQGNGDFLRPQDKLEVLIKYANESITPGEKNV